MIRGKTTSRGVLRGASSMGCVALPVGKYLRKCTPEELDLIPNLVLPLVKVIQ